MAKFTEGSNVQISLFVFELVLSPLDYVSQVISYYRLYVTLMSFKLAIIANIMLQNFSLPSIEKDGYHLLNGMQIHTDNPSTFLIPSDEQKDKLKSGNLVKLIFEIRTVNAKKKKELHGERMWVIILDRDEEQFLGILDNQPYCTDSIKPGLMVYFGSQHIVDIYNGNVDLSEQGFKEYQKHLKKTFGI